MYPNPTGGSANHGSTQSKCLTFDRVFEPDCKQPEVYEGAGVENMVQHVIEGFHSTIFCYGQTGSGKTYSMDGYKYNRSERGIYLPDISTSNNDNFGLVQRSVADLVRLVQPLRQTKNVTMNVSFMQIYNEKIYDLLNPAMFKRNKTGDLNQPTFHYTGV